MVGVDAQWLLETFSSRDKAESALRPYLEGGAMSEHDYNLAISFLPGKARYYPVIYSAGATVLVAGYGRFVKRPPWAMSRVVGRASAANVAGFMFGAVQRAIAHREFYSSLDDGPAFAGILQHLAQDDLYTLSHPQARLFSIAVITEHPQVASRWDEIRAVNARGGKSSTWVALRQGHERRQAPDNDLPSTQVPQPANNADIERAREQASFDAMLEAERKAAGR
ncbi:hypothetical protein BC835DRAFT_1307539 [Cytidiella melzeri]|nr:hypothetical protein BC835DRAFT_1307539 [Cytidiella melzeri]